MIASSAQVKKLPEEASQEPIGFDETPPWDTGSSTKNGGESAALVRHKLGFANWNKYRDRLSQIWSPKHQLWLPQDIAG